MSRTEVFPEHTDVLIAGSGAAGMRAAIAAHEENISDLQGQLEEANANFSELKKQLSPSGELPPPIEPVARTAGTALLLAIAGIATGVAGIAGGYVMNRKRPGGGMDPSAPG